MFTTINLPFLVCYIVENAINQFLEPDIQFSHLLSTQQHEIEPTPDGNSATPPLADDNSTDAPVNPPKFVDNDWMQGTETYHEDVPVSKRKQEHEASAPPRVITKNYDHERIDDLSKAERKKFVNLYLPTKVQLHVENPFGKDNLSQCFKSEPVFRYTWLLLTKSGFLSNQSKKTLGKVHPQYRTLQYLIRKHKDVDFSPLWIRNPNWDHETEFMAEQTRMTTTALLYYDGDIASVVHYVGGMHTYGNMDIPRILTSLKLILKEDTWRDLHRIYTTGCPALANITDTEANYQAYREFGNHQGASDHADILRKALVKTSKRNLMLIADDRLADFCPNVHFQPLNVVDTDHPYRKPRCITNCSTRPFPWCFAVNDWTDKFNEPQLTFAGAFTELVVWIYNLAITYPNERKTAARDDIQNAFPRLKHALLLIGMYSSTFEGNWLINTGQTFGENTCPSNFDVAARARKEVSQAKWFDPTIITQAAKYLPPIPAPLPLTDDERAQMTRATRDSINTGVLDSQGNRRPPSYSHHVDDNMYGDIASQIQRAASASVIGAYEVFGYPKDPPDGPDPITWEKWVDDLSHIDEPVGYGVDMHRLILYLPTPKRAKLAAIMEPWLQMKGFTLREAAELIGQLVHAAQTNREARALYFCLQNAFRREL